MELKKCENCGNEIPENIYNKYNGYCRNCFKDPKQYGKEKEKKLVRKKNIRISIIVIIILTIIFFNYYDFDDNSESIMYFIAADVFIVFLIFLFNTAGKNNSLKENEIGSEDMNNNNFIHANNEKIISSNEIYDVKINEKKEKILIYVNKNIFDEISFKDIIKCEIIEDKNVIMKGGVGRAILGGAIAGGVGAIVGANTRKSKNMVNKLQIQIITSNINNSLHTINIIDENAGIETNSYRYINGIRFANDVYSTIISIINNNTQNMKKSDNEDYYQQLEKLASLKEKNIITEEEFENKKKILLDKI